MLDKLIHHTFQLKKKKNSITKYRLVGLRLYSLLGYSLQPI